MADENLVLNPAQARAGGITIGEVCVALRAAVAPQPGPAAMPGSLSAVAALSVAGRFNAAVDGLTERITTARFEMEAAVTRQEARDAATQARIEASGPR